MTKEAVQFEGIPTDKIFCLYHCIHEGVRGYIFWLLNCDQVFVSTPSEEEEKELWEEINIAIEGSANHIVYLDSVIRTDILERAEIRTEGENPSIIFYFQGGFEFAKPYEELELLKTHHAELMMILSGLQDLRATAHLSKARN